MGEMAASGFGAVALFVADGLPASGFFAAALAVDGIAASGLTAAAFDTAATLGRKGFAGLEDFNGFDGALCDVGRVAFAVCLLVVLPDLAAAFGLFFEAGVFADVCDRARVVFPVAGSGDFLRVFLDIRLPFVAFGGSIIGAIAVLSGQAGIEPAAGQVWWARSKVTRNSTHDPSAR
jgi:hypothetical protein